MRIEVFVDIQRPISTVWDFWAVHHVENHPRWDPTVSLEATSSEPVGVGTVIKRTVTRFGKTTEGRMEIIEFQPERSMRVRTQDGTMAIKGGALFEALGVNETRLSIEADFPGMDEAMREQIQPMMETSATNIKNLIESES